MPSSFNKVSFVVPPWPEMQKLWPKPVVLMAFAAVLSLGPASFAASPVPGLRCSQILRAPHSVSRAVQRNAFETSRGLSDYQQDLHPDFALDIANLKSSEHWIDLGAGKANAQLDFLHQRKISRSIQVPLLTAIAYKLDRWFRPAAANGRLQIVEGAFEDLDISKIPLADVLSDDKGLTSYTEDMTVTLQKIFDLMKVGARYYVDIPTYKLKFLNAEGRLIGLQEFLSQCPSLKVEGRDGTLKITKLKQGILVPQMELSHSYGEVLPSRQFRLLSGWYSSP